jgi:Flp pilus assembly protein TadG
VVPVLKGVDSTRPRGHHGQSLVEFALVLPLLALLLLGSVDLTRAFYYYLALQNASREAARVLIDYPSQYDDTAACTAGHQESYPVIDVSCGAGTLTISPAANGTANPPVRQPGHRAITVTATYAFKPITVLIQWFTGPTLTLKAQTVMLAFY